MKRLYVYDRFKSMGVGRSLCTALIQEAKNQGYKKMRLDTLGRMQPAVLAGALTGGDEMGVRRLVGADVLGGADRTGAGLP